MDLFAAETAPFAVALGVTLAIALIELAGVLIGLSPSEAIDSTLPDADTDMPNLELGPLSQFLNWLSFGRLPALVVLILITTSFGLGGYVLQEAMRRIFGFALEPAVASAPAAIFSLFATHHLGHWLGRLMPREETDAVSTADFIGRVATVFRGTASSGKPAEAKLTDIHGKTHYLLVEPDDEGQSLSEGSQVVLVRREGPVFRAIVQLKPVQ
ncbi:YqiJ family protein [Devosia sp.]|uniref:YqiJ family protein n=1 Tax=Devosia sp. TaxID=1871048 RepID=UPI001AD3953F|nr:YqiJ family protein [Devosia sp.]MBN9332680.1 YqiJ family protein [Devosia sp.]